jgi:hypothetical protein
LVVHLVRQGLLFGADRNITAQMTLRDGTVEVVVTGQAQRPKVLKWPNREVIVGYVGAAEIGNVPADEWVYAFIGRNLSVTDDLNTIAARLRDELDAAFRSGEFEGPSVWHLGGFEKVGGEWAPRVHFIRNTTAINADGSYTVGQGFDHSEELSQANYFGSTPGDEIRASLADRWFSFRQGYDLAAFNTIDQKLREAMEVLMTAGHRPQPLTLPEWAEHVALGIHGYGAYFAAFYPPFEQYVGGGADVVSAAWPT